MPDSFDFFLLFIHPWVETNDEEEEEDGDGDLEEDFNDIVQQLL